MIAIFFFLCVIFPSSAFASSIIHIQTTEQEMSRVETIPGCAYDVTTETVTTVTYQETTFRYVDSYANTSEHPVDYPLVLSPCYFNVPNIAFINCHPEPFDSVPTQGGGFASGVETYDVTTVSYGTTHYSTCPPNGCDHPGETTGGDTTTPEPGTLMSVFIGVCIIVGGYKYGRLGE